MTRALECKLHKSSKVANQNTMTKFSVSTTDVVEVDENALLENNKPGTKARSILFALGSTGAILTLRTQSINAALKRFAGKGLIEFFSGFYTSKSIPPHYHKPTLIVQFNNGNSTLKRLRSS